MRLLAISDLHVGLSANHKALEAIQPHPDDWLVLAGDVGETIRQLQSVLTTLAPRFKQLVWVPGNHELWSHPDDPLKLGGVARYERFVKVCRDAGVLTPEDPFPLWQGAGGAYRLVPMFLHYDYSFRPDDVPQERAVEWAMEEDILCQDERYITCDPYPTAAAWCAARCDQTAARLDALAGESPDDVRWVLINHNPLHRRMCVLPRVPRFTIWSGTRRTEDWHRRYPVEVVISGHLHIRSTRWLEGVRCEEVSLGYPSQRPAGADINAYIRQVLPAPAALADQRDRWYR